MELSSKPEFVHSNGDIVALTVKRAKLPHVKSSGTSRNPDSQVSQCDPLYLIMTNH